jgi:hypothetical protein
MCVLNRSLAVGLGLALALMSGLLASVRADEAPIAGVVKSIDAAAGTFLVESTSKGKVRQVTIHMRPESKIIRFERSMDAVKGFNEVAAKLAEVKAGWLVSVTAKHEGDKEVAEVVRVVHEK